MGPPCGDRRCAQVSPARYASQAPRARTLVRLRPGIGVRNNCATTPQQQVRHPRGLGYRTPDVEPTPSGRAGPAGRRRVVAGAPVRVGQSTGTRPSCSDASDEGAARYRDVATTQAAHLSVTGIAREAPTRDPAIDTIPSRARTAACAHVAPCTWVRPRVQQIYRSAYRTYVRVRGARETGRSASDGPASRTLTVKVLPVFAHGRSRPPVSHPRALPAGGARP